MPIITIDILPIAKARGFVLIFGKNKFIQYQKIILNI
jgi:hypothetical protein